MTEGLLLRAELPLLLAMGVPDLDLGGITTSFMYSQVACRALALSRRLLRRFFKYSILSRLMLSALPSHSLSDSSSNTCKLPEIRM